MLENTSARESKTGLRVLAMLGGAHLFGHERANIEALRALREEGAEIKVVISSRFGREQIAPHLDALGIPWIAAPFGYYWGKYLFTWKFFYLFVNLYGILATSWIVRREGLRWKATHLFGGSWLHLHYAIFALNALPIPLVFRAGDEYPARGVIRKLVAGPVLRGVAVLVCNCEFLRSRFQAIEGCPTRVEVIYNSPPVRSEPEGEATNEEMPTTPDDAVVVLFVGQVTEAKGVSLLVEAAVQLLRNMQDVVVWIVGDDPWGDLKGRLTSQVAEAGFAERILLMGYRADVPRLFEAADIHACPSTWNEPSPNVVFEAKRAGLPTVAFRVGGIPELLDHKGNAFLCSDKSAEGFAEGLEYFLDASRRAAAGDAAKRSLRNKFGEQRFRKEWWRVFSNSLAS